ncbi:DUF349 domain-containing protein [Mobilicoccus pelagius]|uniref:DUF349 domain-containing protein n=1 Tax=Mobilicoccus pelagius TaxID=746032 RepID=UPI0002D9F5BA|nr:DUF349 domain-containing protein [Mobilicoccus pelagius]
MSDHMSPTDPTTADHTSATAGEGNPAPVTEVDVEQASTGAETTPASAPQTPLGQEEPAGENTSEADVETASAPQTEPATDAQPSDAEAPTEAAEASMEAESSPETASEGSEPATTASAPAAPAPTPTPAQSPTAVLGAAVATPRAESTTPAAPVHAPVTTDPSAHGRVAEDGTVFVRIGEEEREVGSYPGASAEEALAYFARKFDEVAALAEILHQRVTQTDLPAKEGADGLKRLRDAVSGLRAVGDFPALYARIEDIATAVEVRRTTENQERAAAREEALKVREAIVSEAETIAGQEEAKVQWKQSSSRMRALLDEWKSAQKNGPKLDRETEQALWHRLSGARNSFDKMRRVHFAQLGSVQAEAKARKEELVAEAEKLKDSTEWGQTAGAFKRLMDSWRQAGRASRADDDALWKRFKAAQDHFFDAKDQVAAAENVEFEANLKVKEALLEEAQKILPVKDVEVAKARLRPIQEKWDAAGKVPRSAMKRIEDGMRKVEQAIRDADQQKWKRTDPEVAARAASLAEQAEKSLAKHRKDLEKAEASGDEAKIAKAREALEARQAWLELAQRGLGEFGN